MHNHWNHDERVAWHFGGRGGGPGMGWGRGGRGGRGFGGGAFRVGKMLADGDLRVVVLALLTDGPRHGYDIIKALEEKSSGIYSPSPGVVYPTLTYLEEVGYVSATSEGNKKVYAITDTGRAHLEENRDLADMVLDGIEKFGRRMAQAKAWWEGDRDGGRGPRHPRRHRRGQRGPPRPEGGDRREASRTPPRRSSAASPRRCATPPTPSARLAARASRTTSSTSNSNGPRATASSRKRARDPLSPAAGCGVAPLSRLITISHGSHHLQALASASPRVHIAAGNPSRSPSWTQE